MLLAILGEYTANRKRYPEFAGRIKVRFCESGTLDYSGCRSMDGRVQSPQRKSELQSGQPSKESFDDLTQLFFLAHYYMDLCFGEITKYIFVKKLETLTSPDDSPVRCIYSFYVHLFSGRFMSLLANFLAFTSFVLLDTVKPIGKATSLKSYLESEDFPTTASASLEALPEHVFGNLHEAFVFYMSNPEDDIFRANETLLPLIKKLYEVLGKVPYVAARFGKRFKDFAGLLAANPMLGRVSIIHHDS